MKRYLALFLGMIVVACIIGPIARKTRSAAVPAAATQASEVAAIAITVRGGAVTPETAGVPQGSRVRLTVTNRGDAPCRLGLAGYEGRIDLEVISPGTTAHCEFLADRPGEDFTWLIDDRPAGRFQVTGSHLIGDHR